MKGRSGLWWWRAMRRDRWVVRDAEELSEEGSGVSARVLNTAAIAAAVVAPPLTVAQVLDLPDHELSLSLGIVI